MSPLRIESHFDLSNACTGCVFKCCSDNKPLYINSNNEVETWSKRKGNADSLQKTVSRIETIAKDKIEVISSGDDDKTLSMIHTLVLSELKSRPLTKCDLRMILKIIYTSESDDGK